jgi:hypothetical protein
VASRAFAILVPNFAFHRGRGARVAKDAPAMRFLQALACFAIAALLAGCAGRDLAPAATVAAPTAARRTESVSIVVKIPKRPHRRRRGRYISPATLSMTLAFAPASSGSALTKTLDLTPTTNGCASTLANTVCSAAVLLTPGRYTATISTYDATGGANGGGHVLSTGQNVPFTVAAGRANALPMTLDGVPHAIVVTPITPGLHGSQGAGFTLYGATTQNFSVVATDAQSDPIVGAGAPAFAISIQNGSGWTVPTPLPATPNTLSVTPPATGDTSATVAIAATYPGTTPATCAGIGATVCSAQITIAQHLQNVWILDSGSSTIDEYAYPYTGASPIESIADSGGNIGGTNQNAQGFAMDANGDIFVANCSSTCGQAPADNVTEYAAPGYSSTATATITNGIANPEALAIDSAGHLFVANQNGSVTEYQAPYSNTSAPIATITSGIRVPVGLAIDSNDDLFVLDCAVSCNTTADADAILKYASPYAAAPANVGNVLDPTAGALALDGSGNVFAGGAGGVTEYVTGTSTPKTIAGSSEALSLALDAGGNLFVGGCPASCGSAGSGSLTEFQSPYTASGKAIDAGNIASPTALAIDGAGNLLEANGFNSELHVYAWPYTGAARISTGTLNGPIGLILTP